MIRSRERAPRSALQSLAVVLVGALSLAGCVTNQTPEVRAVGSSTQIDFDRGRSATVTPQSVSESATSIEAPIRDVWLALLQALPAVGVPLETVSEPTWTAGAEAAAVKRRIGGRWLSSYITCGGTAGVADVADTYAVTLSVLTTLREDGEQTRVETRVAGAANDPFTSVPARGCVSKGRLEARVDSAVRALVASQ